MITDSLRAKWRCRHLLASIAISFALTTTGCSNIDPGAAAKLASTGTASGQALADAVTTTGDALFKSNALVILANSVAPNDAPPPATPSQLAAYKKIKAELRAHAQVYRALGPVYTSFGNLAGYDASKEFDGAVKDLGGSVNNLATVVEGKPTKVIEDNALSLISTIGGMTADEIKKSKLKSASENIRKNLDAVLTLLKAQKGNYAALQSMYLKDANNASYYLWKAGVLDARPYLQKYTSLSGMSLVTDAKVTTNDNKNLGPLLIDLVTLRNEEIDAESADFYDTAVDTLTKLVKSHQDFEEGDPIDVAYIDAQVNRLNGLVQALTKALAE